MFLLSTALKNVRRHWRKSALYGIICIIAVLTLQIYMGSIDSTRTQLTQLPSAMPVSARVSDITGSQVVGLEIEQRVVEGLSASEYVEDLRLTVLLRNRIGEAPPASEMRDLRPEVFTMGINTLAALEGLKEEDITWFDGYDQSAFSGDASVCIVDSFLMAANNWVLGDSVQLNLFYYNYVNRTEVHFYTLETIEARIVGETNLYALPIEGETPQILIPFGSAQASFARQDIPFRANSAAFGVVNPLVLNAFKTQMKEELKLRSINPGGDSTSNKGIGLLVSDATFISAAERLQESLDLLGSFLPLLIAVLAAIGYFVSYLMIQNRRDEYALLRLLGLNKQGSMALYFIEMAVLTLCGSLVGVGLGSLTGLGGLVVSIIILALFCTCFLAGSLIALWRLGRTNVMLALARND